MYFVMFQHRKLAHKVYSLILITYCTYKLVRHLINDVQKVLNRIAKDSVIVDSKLEEWKLSKETSSILLENIIYVYRIEIRSSTHTKKY